jgi:hypothetical protein
VAAQEVVEQVVGELAQREDEDQVEEKLEWGDLFLLGLTPLAPHACRSLSESTDYPAEGEAAAAEEHWAAM